MSGRDWNDAGREGAPILTLADAAQPFTPRPNGADHDGPLPVLDVNRWTLADMPSRSWTVPGRFARRNVSLLSGDGGVGKSILLAQLAAAHVLERDWLGSMPEPGPVLMLCAEDDEDDLWRRFAAIVEHYREPMKRLVGRLHLAARAGEDTLLGIPDRAGIIQPTRLFLQLNEAVCDLKPANVIIDTVADVFGGNENDRAQVRGFIGLLRRLAIAADTSVILASHPSLHGISTGSGISGSTAWHNSVRARGYLRSITDDAGAEPDETLRELSFMKNQFGPVAERIVLRFRNGVFVPEPTAGSAEQLAAAAKIESIFLDLVVRYRREGRYVNDRGGKAYAPAVFEREPEAKAAKIKKGPLEDAMLRLFAAKRIRIEEHGRPSRPSFRIVPS